MLHCCAGRILKKSGAIFGLCTAVVDAIMDDDFAARWRKRSSIVVEHSMDLGVGGDLEVNSGRTEVPTVLGKVGIGATADGNKVRLEGVDCSFGFVQTLVAGGCQLVVEAVLFDGGDKVEQSGREAILRQCFVTLCKRSDYFG